MTFRNPQLDVYDPGTLAVMDQAFAAIWAITHGCPCRKLNPDILVVQSAQDWQGQNATDGVDGARHLPFPKTPSGAWFVP